MPFRILAVLSSAGILLACNAEKRAPLPPPSTKPPAPEACVAESAAYPLRLLTRAEFDRSVRDLLGDTTSPANRLFPPETALIGFENDGEHHRPGPYFVEQSLRVAEDVAARALSERPNLVAPCVVSRDVSDSLCLVDVIDRHAHRAFRRPLTPLERQALVQLAANTLTAFGFDDAVRAVLTNLLLAPAFLYRFDGAANATATDSVDVVTIDQYTMAERLSYLLWGTMPDDALFAAAAAGRLNDDDQLHAEVLRMLADAKAKDGVAAFFRQWLGVSRLATVEKDLAYFPSYSRSLNQSWHESLERFVIDAVFHPQAQGGFDALFTSDVLHVDAALASFYGLPPPRAANSLWTTHHATGERAGLLTQPALMALLADTHQSSPIRRGVWLREKFLCQPVSPPPPGLNVVPPAADPTLTTRERFFAHTADASCRSCHALIDPVGFGFEHYDASGAYRVTENGRAVDASGEVAYTSDPAIEGPFDGAIALGTRLSTSTQVQSCFADQLFTFAFGRVPDEQDRCVRDALVETLQRTHDIQAALVTLATSPAMRTARISAGTQGTGVSP